MHRAVVRVIVAASILTGAAAGGILAQSATGIVISEVACTAGEDWVELYNQGPESISLEGWNLTLDSAPSQPLALSGSIGGGSFLVVYPPTGLPDTGDGMLLQGPNGKIAYAMSYGTRTSVCSGLPAPSPGQSLHLVDLAADPSLCRYEPAEPSPGGPPPAPTPTPTATDTPPATPTATATVSPGSVVLTEVYYQGACEREWAEIASLADVPISLDGWWLRDNEGSQPLALSLGPGEVMVVQGGAGTVVPGCGGATSRADAACMAIRLADSGDVIELVDGTGRVLDSLVYGSSATPGAVPLVPAGQSLARLGRPDGTLDAWTASTLGPGCLQPVPTPTATPDASATPSAPSEPTPDSAQAQSVHSLYLPVAACNAAQAPERPLLISEVLYQGKAAGEGDEFVELRNFTAAPLDLTGYKLGDAEYAGDGEGMYAFPVGAQVPAGGVLVVARCANSFASRFGRPPDFEFAPGGCLESPEVPNMQRYTAWGRGSLNLSNTGDEVLLLGPDDAILDAVAFGSGGFGTVGLAGEAVAPAPLSLHRVGVLDRDDMSLDFGHEGPSPGVGLEVPVGPLSDPGPSWAGMTLYWGNLHAHSSYSDGAGPPELAFGRARLAGLHFYALTDHGYMLREVEWGRLRGVASDATVPGRFLALAGFEWTHRTEGHMNVLGTTDLASREMPETGDRDGLLAWAEGRPGTVLQVNHPGLGGTYPGQEPVSDPADRIHLQEVINGGGTAARVYEQELLESWRHGWLMAPTAGSDTHDWLWGSDTAARTGVWAEELTETAVLDALRNRRVFASEDASLGIGWRCGGQWMGESVPALADSCALFYFDGEGEPATVAVRGLDGSTLASWSVVSGREIPFQPPAQGNFWLSVTQGDGDHAWTPPIWRGE